MDLTCKRTLKNGLEADFSVFHGCAAGFLCDKSVAAEYADGVVLDASVIAAS